MKSSLSELNSFWLDVHGHLLGLRDVVDHVLVHVGRVDHQAQLRTGQVIHFAALHLVPHLQVPRRLRTYLPVPQHPQRVAQLALVPTACAALLPQGWIAQWRPASLHQEFSRIILLRQYHRTPHMKGKQERFRLRCFARLGAKENLWKPREITLLLRFSLRKMGGRSSGESWSRSLLKWM